MGVIAVAVVLSLALSGAAYSQTREQAWAWCRGENVERLIRGCTDILHSSVETPKSMALAYFNRGRAYADQGEYDRAVHDLREAVRLDPAFPDAFNSLGIAHEGKGDPEKAIGDFTEAIRLDPNFAIAIFNRGLAYQRLGRAKQAAADFAHAREVGPRLSPSEE
jgi:tetratricopeptide (TPR) repeat protein